MLLICKKKRINLCISAIKIWICYNGSCFLQSLDLPRLDRIIRCSLQSHGQNLSLPTFYRVCTCMRSCIPTVKFSLFWCVNFDWDFRATSSGDRARAWEQCLNGGGSKTWRQRAMVEDGFEGYLGWKISCVAFIWWPGITHLYVCLCLMFNFILQQ